MSSDKHCCVPGCKNSLVGGCTLHHFPNPEKHRERFNTWMSAIKNIDIHGMENEYIFKNRRVCHLHFEAKYICCNNRISNIAVPTLNLPGSLKGNYPIPARRPLCQVIDVPQPSTSTGPKYQHRYSKKGAVPSIFPLSKAPTKQAIERSQGLENRNNRTSLLLNPPSAESGSLFQESERKRKATEDFSTSNQSTSQQDDKTDFTDNTETPEQQLTESHENAKRIKPTLERDDTVAEIYDQVVEADGDNVLGEDDIANSPTCSSPDIADMEVKMCRICLQSNMRLLSIESYGLSTAYKQLTGVSVEHDDGLPRELCVECATLLDKYHKFRDKSIRGDQLLRQIYDTDNLATNQCLEELEEKISELASKLDFNKEMTCIDIAPDTATEELPRNDNNPEREQENIDLDMSVVDHDELSTVENSDFKDQKQDSEQSLEVIMLADDETTVLETNEDLDPKVTENLDSITNDDEMSIKEEELDHTEPDPLSSRQLQRTKEDAELRNMFVVTQLGLKEQFRVHNEKTKLSQYVNSDYLCNLCNEGFNSGLELRMHVALHSASKPATCVICKLGFNQVTDLQWHRKSVHLYKYMCNRCDCIIWTRRTALEHLDDHNILEDTLS